jgi:hypothetical protein
MSEVRKGTSRKTENENKRRKIFNKVLNMNWDYVRGKKKQKENKNKQTKREPIVYINIPTHNEPIVYIYIPTHNEPIVYIYIP